MTATQLNAQIWRDMSVLADSEPMMERVANYLRKLVREKEDSTLMTREELFAKIEKAEKDYREGKTYAMLPGESFKEFRKRIGK
ncbi:MAG: hypothetical protein IJR87_00985 [Bacteroidaceae bacterium]|nr:hypothetical protein [Bacteroidaceae bacterium]